MIKHKDAIYLIWDHKNDHEIYENSSSSSDDTEYNHNQTDKNPKTPENQSEELPQTSSEDMVLILKEL